MRRRLRSAAGRVSEFTSTADRAEDQLRAARAIVERFEGRFGAAVPLALVLPRQVRELRPPRHLGAHHRYVLPVRAAFAEAEDAGAVARHEHCVIPGADRFADAARGGELRGVTLPFRRAAR